MEKIMREGVTEQRMPEMYKQITYRLAFVLELYVYKHIESLSEKKTVGPWLALTRL